MREAEVRREGSWEGEEVRHLGTVRLHQRDHAKPFPGITKV